jgi:hypothetical protein
MAWMADLMDALGQDSPKRHGLVQARSAGFRRNRSWKTGNGVLKIEFIGNCHIIFETPDACAPIGGELSGLPAEAAFTMNRHTHR